LRRAEDEALAIMDGQPHSIFALVEGVRLHWAEIGADTGKTPLVLLHGLYDSHMTWKAVAPALAQDRRVLMPDLPGHGLSERPNASYKLGWHAQVMSAWFHTAGLATADVLGHSYGGGVAQQMLLLDSRERMRRLILVASGGLGREVGFALRLASLPLVVELMGQPFMRLGTRLALRGASYPAVELAELSEMNARRGSARAFARTVRDIADWHGQRRAFMQRAHEIAELPPIALYWGDRDQLIPLTHAESFMSVVEHVAFNRFAGCGHYLHRENPDEFVRAVREFLDAPSQPAARLRSERRRWPRRPSSPAASAKAIQGHPEQ
jgi:pimeloyl-ACP methyl ester carboxylesterase